MGNSSETAISPPVASRDRQRRDVSDLHQLSQIEARRFAALAAKHISEGPALGGNLAIGRIIPIVRPDITGRERCRLLSESVSSKR
jgi:hypothetical protein